MANAYLDAYRAAGTKAPIAGGSSTGSDNPYLKSYRTTQLPGVMDTFNKQKAEQQASQKLKAQQDADKKKQDEANSPLGFLKGIAGGVANFISQASKPVGQGGVNVVANASQSVEQALNQQKKQATKQIKAGQPLSTVIPASGIGVLDKITGASDFAGKAGNTLAAVPALSGAILAKPGSKTRKDLEQAAATNVKKSFISPDVANPKKGANPLDTTAKFAGEFAGAGASAAGFIGVPEAKGIQLITKAATDAGLSDIGKSVFTKAVEGAQKKTGRDLTQPELTQLAEQTKRVIPESKPEVKAEVQKPFAPLDDSTKEKAAELKIRHDTTPVPEGHTRLFQMEDKGAGSVKSDQYFKTPEEVSNFANGRSENSDFKFVDVPTEKVKPVAGKPTVFKVETKAPPKNVSKLSEVLDNKELYQKYPKLKDVEFRLTNEKTGLLSGGSGGSYTKLGNRGRISIGKDGWDYIFDETKIKQAEIKKANITELAQRDSAAGLSEEDLRAKYTKQINDIENEIYDLQSPKNAVGKKMNETGYSRLAHEIEHAKQDAKGETMSHTDDYENRPHEQAAFEAQSKHAKDIKDRIETPKKSEPKKKDIKTAIDARIYETHPHLFHAEATGKVFNETGTGTIPKLHVDDVKKYFGNKEDLPSIYKRTTGERNIDQLAQQAGYDDVDTFVEHIQQELRTRGDAREATQKLAEMRKDPQIIADAQKALDEDNARYGGTQDATPSEKDLRDYNKSRGDNVKPLKNKPSLTTDEIDTGIKGNRNVKGDTPSGNALRIAIENKLDTGKDIAEYKGINIEDQKQKLIKLLENDHQRAIDIIDGKANPPSDLKAQFVHQALEEEAKITGDGELLQKLKKSPINRELSESAQNLRIAAERDPNSPVELMRQIEDAKKLAIEKRGGSIKKTVNDIGKKVDAATPKVKKEDWASFVESLKC